MKFVFLDNFPISRNPLKNSFRDLKTKTRIFPQSVLVKQVANPNERRPKNRNSREKIYKLLFLPTIREIGSTKKLTTSPNTPPKPVCKGQKSGV